MSRDEKAGYNRFLLLVAGLGGLLYGVDVGIIAGALPYLEATSGLNAGQLSIVVAAVLLGSVISTMFAGLLAASALYTLFNEGSDNWQSLWTCAVYLLFAVTLWQARAVQTPK